MLQEIDSSENAHSNMNRSASQNIAQLLPVFTSTLHIYLFIFYFLVSFSSPVFFFSRKEFRRPKENPPLLPVLSPDFLCPQKKNSSLQLLFFLFCSLFPLLLAAAQNSPPLFFLSAPSFFPLLFLPSFTCSFFLFCFLFPLFPAATRNSPPPFFSLRPFFFPSTLSSFLHLLFFSFLLSIPSTPSCCPKFSPPFFFLSAPSFFPLLFLPSFTRFLSSRLLLFPASNCSLLPAQQKSSHVSLSHPIWWSPPILHPGVANTRTNNK